MVDAHDQDETIAHPGLQLLAADFSASASRNIFLSAKEVGKIVIFNLLSWIELFPIPTHSTLHWANYLI